jgi:methionyl aminopeptidase
VFGVPVSWSPDRGLFRVFRAFRGGMITLKRNREIGLMREAGKLVAEAHRIAAGMIEPGMTTREIDAAIESFYDAHGAVPLFKNFPGEVPFPAVTCISVNEQVVHGIPGDYPLQSGDIVSLDTGCRLGGWCGDAAWTYPVGRVDGLKRRLLEAGEAALAVAIRETGRRRWWSEVARAMQDEAARAGFRVVEEFVGHGIGREMHEDPQVPGFAGAAGDGRDFRIEPGLVLAIEPVLHAGSGPVRVGRDDWTVRADDGRPSVHFEHTVALTEHGTEVLTRFVCGG